MHTLAPGFVENRQEGRGLHDPDRPEPSDSEKIHISRNNIPRSARDGRFQENIGIGITADMNGFGRRRHLAPQGK